MSSIRQIAAACGFSKSTVAAALRGESEIAPSTRAAVLAAAQSMGYSTDARMAELMSHIRVGRPSRAVCNLAWLNTSPQADIWTARDYNRIYLDGARHRAEILGYSLDDFWMGNPRLTAAQLTRQLKARGIRGLILPMPDTCDVMETLDWQNYATVALDESIPKLKLNRVLPNHHRNMIIACEAIFALGYRRPALMISEHVEQQSALAITASFTRCQQKIFGAIAIPLPTDMDDTNDSIAWVKKHRPDIVIGNTHQLCDDLVAAGFKVPSDIAYAHLHLGPDTPGWAGINPGQAELGAAAVEAVLALLHRKETGLPPRAKEISLLGTWIDGWTAPYRKSKAALPR